MKRTGNLIMSIAELENLYLAWTKARRGKTFKNSVISYQHNLHENIRLLQKQILTGNINVGNYSFFYVYEPKKRNIAAADFSERVLHHALINICYEYFEKHLVYHSYATRKNKGTYAALDYAKEQTRKYKWFAKLDIRKFFDTIDHRVLKNILVKMFKDKTLLKIFFKIIDSYQVSLYKGIPIGNLTSQYFANRYLSDADHFLLEKIKIPAYVRYMDDMIMFGNDKTVLKQKVKVFTDYIQSSLLIDFKIISINNTLQGLPFLGYRLFPNTIKLNHKSKQRFKKKIKLYNKLLEKDIWTEQDYKRHTEPLLAFVKYADTFNLRKIIIFGDNKRNNT